jgi:DNA-binding NarL/FixJ family response regulator
MVERWAKGEEMSVRRVRPWTSHEDIVLQRLAAAGKHAAAIAAEMNRSESAIRSRARKLNIMLARAQGGLKAKK